MNEQLRDFVVVVVVVVVVASSTSPFSFSLFSSSLKSDNGKEEKAFQVIALPCFGTAGMISSLLSPTETHYCLGGLHNSRALSIL